MPSLLIKDLSPATHRQLKEQAKAHHRSMQKEAALLLNSLLRVAPIAEYSDRFVMAKPPTAAELVRDLKAGRK
jgi:plasmid stability protein